MKKNLLILGAGQYGHIAKETAEAIGCFEKINFLDDKNSIAVGKLNDYEKYSKSYSCAIAAFGNPALRLEWISKLEKACYNVVMLIHPKAYISSTAQIGKGSIIEPMAVVHTESVISVGCIISAGSVINHNSFIGEGCHIDCNATVASNSIVPPGEHIMCGAVFKCDSI